MQKTSALRIAWLFPSLARGFYWQPVLSEFTRLFPKATVYTGDWPGFAQGFEGRFTVRTVGKAKFIETSYVSNGYTRAFVALSPKIIGHLAYFNPHVVFTAAFSMWTAVALLLKPWLRWRVIIVYDGSSPNIDFEDSIVRLVFRRAMARSADAFITNSRGGKAYLTTTLCARYSRVFVRPYEVPHAEVLSNSPTGAEPSVAELQRPIFLFVGEIVPRKGLHLLIEACSLLWRDGYRKWTLVVVGDGPQRNELDGIIKNGGFDDRIKWAGWVSYGNLGKYFQRSDAFIFPTLEDIWGMVALEAMAFGKPVICSKWAGAAEMVSDNQSGYIVDPCRPDQLVSKMKQFIDNPHLTQLMGQRSKEKLACHTPRAVARHLSEVVKSVIEQR
jgi:glycosyltransferase involved in cell wall biosynthesis